MRKLDTIIEHLYEDPGYLVAAYIALDEEPVFALNGFDFAYFTITEPKPSDIVVQIQLKDQFGTTDELLFNNEHEARKFVAKAVISRRARNGLPINHAQAIELADFYFGKRDDIDDIKSSITIFQAL